MNELTIHPNVHSTGPSKGLLQLLERLWIKDRRAGDGLFFIVSGFGNYNGGVRFYDVFRRHIAAGGRVIAVFGGSTSMRLTSKQVVRELLAAGVEVHLINRKRILHAKSYGAVREEGDMLVVTSGNFTGPGMSQNIEMAVLLDPETTATLKFSGLGMLDALLAQAWDYHQPPLDELEAPAWRLLFDEVGPEIPLDDTQFATMILRLSHADTARIMADPGTNAGLGSQYFWLSKDSFDFVPALTEVNRRGEKATYSTVINVDFADLGRTEPVRVTFEAQNNLDFRLGTGPLRYTKLAREGDIAAITRLSEDRYELRLYSQESAVYARLLPYAVTFAGHQGKRYGFMPNDVFAREAGIAAPLAHH